MEEKTWRLVLSLQQALADDPRINTLNALEEKLQKDEVVHALSLAKDKAEEAYNDALAHQDETSPEAVSKQKALYAAKLALDSYPLVQEYNAAYIAVRDLDMRIDDLLFHDFRFARSCEAKR